jgi:signal transduction histidine kinase
LGELAAAELQCRKLIADVAPELRTPLAVIQANTEWMPDFELKPSSGTAAQPLDQRLRLLSLAKAEELRLETDLTGFIQRTGGRFQP